MLRLSQQSIEVKVRVGLQAPRTGEQEQTHLNMHLHLQCSDIKVQNLTLLQQAFNYYTCTIKYILITCCVGYDGFDLPSVGLYVICSWEFLALLNLVFWLFNEYVNWYNFLEIATMNFVKLRWYKGHNFTRIFWFHYFSGILTLLNLEFILYIKLVQ